MSFICFRMVDFPDSPAPTPGLVFESAAGWWRQLTEEKHLDLIPLHHLIPLQLNFNFLISLLALLLFGAHATTHLDVLKQLSRTGVGVVDVNLRREEATDCKSVSDEMRSKRGVSLGVSSRLSRIPESSVQRK